jgi:hypothetical protein
MRLIATPDFAPAHARRGEITFHDTVTLGMYRRVQDHRSELLAAAHAELEAYFDRMGLPDPGSFPYSGALTGEYYWDGDEGYADGGFVGLDGGDPAKHRLWRVRVMLQARCLGRRTEGAAPSDYCGVDVWQRFDPLTGRFEVYYTGHKVI